jgi:hypothetical protein
MKHKSNPGLRTILSSSFFLMMSGFLFGGAAFAGDQKEMIIDLETEDFHIEQLNISDFETGDTETIYTDGGKTIDVVKTDAGADIFIDGEKLDLPDLDIHSLHADSEEARYIIVDIECEAEADEDCTAGEHWAVSADDQLHAHEAMSHKIIIRKEVHSTDEI